MPIVGGTTRPVTAEDAKHRPAAESDEAKSKAPDAGAPNANAAKPDAPKTDASKPDASKVDAPSVAKTIAAAGPGPSEPTRRPEDVITEPRGHVAIQPDVLPPSRDAESETEGEADELDLALERVIRSDSSARPPARPVRGIIGAAVAANVPPESVAGEPVPMTMPRASALGEDVQHPWGQTWFSLMEQRWTSIVLVPAEPGISTVEAAKALAEVGGRYQFEPIQVIDAGDVASGSLQGVLDTIQVFDGSEARLLIAVSSPLTHDAAIPSARAADGAVLVVRMGRTRIAQAQRTMAAIGTSHFIGAIALRD